MKWILSLFAIAAVSFGGWRFVENQEQERATVEAVTVLAPLIEYRTLYEDGRSPIVGAGPYAGEKTEVDHIVPRSLAPDLDNLLINLEFLPRTLNRRKSDTVTDRAYSMAKRFHDAGMMTPESWRAVQGASERKGAQCLA